MKTYGLWSRAAFLLALGAVVSACDDKRDVAPTRVAPPPSASVSQPATARATRMVVAEQGSAAFLIDAPLEKIKGKASRFRGSWTVDPGNLDLSRGEVDVDLTTLVTHTFEDQGKNAKQTKDARNWLELGSDVDPKERGENQWVRFTIKSVKATPHTLEAAPEVGGRRRVELTAGGDLWLHGANSPKTVRLAASFKGPVNAPTEVTLTTLEPLRISLKEHDVKPRDLAGKFIQGALEQVGDKIVDEVQVSFELAAMP